MALNWYQCKACGIAIKKESVPSSIGCSAANVHNWTMLAEVGTKIYHCSECDTVIEVKYYPSSCGCPKASVHNWRTL